MVEFKRRNYRGDGLSARHVVFANVGQSEQAALDDIGRIFEVLMECFLRNVEYFDFDVLTEIGAIDQKLQASPSRFECLKCWVVQDGIELPAELLVL
ncbi:hypothetical protein WL81_15440, partial [Burkholderia ubonensis]